MMQHCSILAGIRSIATLALGMVCNKYEQFWASKAEERNMALILVKGKDRCLREQLLRDDAHQTGL